MKLRHAPLLIVREMARHATHRRLVAETLERVIQRADELAEFVAIYWKDGRVPLSAQVKKGAGLLHFLNSTSISLPSTTVAGRSSCGTSSSSRTPSRVMRHRRVSGRSSSGTPRYDPTPGKLRCRSLGKEAADGTKSDKREAWERLLREQKVGALALLRNLRNMREAGVDNALVTEALGAMNASRVLPFRFLAAAPSCAAIRRGVGAGDAKSVASQAKLPGRTIVLVDVSGSMTAPLSKRVGNAADRRGVRSSRCWCARLPRRPRSTRSRIAWSKSRLCRGFALRDAIDASQPHNGTLLGCVGGVAEQERALRPSDRHHRRAGARFGSRAETGALCAKGPKQGPRDRGPRTARFWLAGVVDT